VGARAPVKFVGGVLGIGSGLALGREGPTIQMGAAVAEMVGRWLRTTPHERRTLIAAGAGAGLAAAFNAPLAGLIFVLEEVQRDFTPSVFTATFIASVTADVVTRWFDGQSPVFHIAVGQTPPIASLPAFLVLGLAAGVLGVAFNRGLLAGLDLFQRAGRWPAGLTGAVVGAGVGLVAWFAPSVVGTGSGMLEGMFAGRTTMGMLLALFALRFALTSLSYGSGAPGGIFAPLLFLGAALGLVVGDLARRVSPSVEVAPAAFAVVGMAAYFAAIVRAPLTGIVLIVEMTGRYDLMLPLLVACLAAYATADVLGDLPIYERLLERELARGHAEPEGPLLVELTVDHAAPFDGKEVRELDLPTGCVLITVRRSGHEHVPTADMPIHAGDHLALLVAPEAMSSMGTLRKGTERVPDELPP
jgi:CIC family chloride channel protein